MELKIKNKIILFFLMVMTFHVAHILEETWGHFWIYDAINSIGLFLFINWILFCIPVVLLYLIVLDKRAGYYLSIAYALFMALNGIGHNIATIVSGRYFGGFAGGVSGLGLIISGIPLFILLYKNIPGKTG